MLLNAQTIVHNTASTRFCMCAQIYTLTGRQLVIGLQTGLRLCTLFFSWNRRIREKMRRAPLSEEAGFQTQRQAAMLNCKIQNCILDAQAIPTQVSNLASLCDVHWAWNLQNKGSLKQGPCKIQAIPTQVPNLDLQRLPG